MNVKIVCSIALVIILAACTAPRARKLSQISLGMTKSQVIAVMGKPDSVAAKGGKEYLNYRLATSTLDFDESDTSSYFVRLVNGRVDAYGHRGDFGTAGTIIKRIEVHDKDH